MTDKDNQNHAEVTPDKSSGGRFAHLSRSSKVTVKNNSNVLILIITGFAVVFFLVFMFTSHGKHKDVTKKTGPLAMNNSLILKENEARLKKLQENQRAGLPVGPQMPKFHVNTTGQSKAMKTRENAPTQMYSMQGAGSEGSDTGSSSQTKNSVLVGTGKFSKFANSQNSSASTVEATKIAHPSYTIAEGEFIHGVLETAINSDLPGMVRAVIDKPVYAYVGEKPLIPAGSRLIGQYSSMPSNGSATARVFVIWNRIITPSGISIMINSPGTDGLGRAGIGANSIDTHFFKMFGTAALLSVMSATSATSGVGDMTQPNSANMYRQSISSAFGQAAQNSLSKNMNIKPTLHVYQGHAINVFVAHDVDLFSILGTQGANDDNDSSSDSPWGFIK